MSYSEAASTVDAVCVGFGPAAIALACILGEAREEGSRLGTFDVRFLERTHGTAWHPELLIDGADINHNLLRDLVTPRNPRSPFSFAMYLKEKDRMFDFGLLGRPASRREWSDYIGWVARQVSCFVTYGETVREVLPVIEHGRLARVRVEVATGALLTRNLVVASGSSPCIPDLFVPHLGETLFHTSEFLTRFRAFGATSPRTWLVVGSGQSASEAILEIISKQPDVSLLSVHRSIGFRVTQLGHFPNQAFSPRNIDYFHGLGPNQRRQYLARSQAVNYAGIDPDESAKLFSLIYEDGLAGRDRLQVLGHHAVTALEPRGGGYVVTLQDIFTGEQRQNTVDAVLLATGYQQHRIPQVLANLQPWLADDVNGGLSVDRDYKIVTMEDAEVRIFANGLAEHSHGISDAQSFSNIALRADRIMQSLTS